MAREIERKFLLGSAEWRAGVVRSIAMQQGYLGAVEHCSVRVRLEDGAAHLNIKSAQIGIEREEFEYAIPSADARYMLAHLCGERRLEKTRHLVPFADHIWEIDEFGGANAGLVVAEIELAAVDEGFQRPPWLGEEVSGDLRYYNVCLVERPYASWRSD